MKRHRVFFIVMVGTLLCLGNMPLGQSIAASSQGQGVQAGRGSLSALADYATASVAGRPEAGGLARPRPPIRAASLSGAPAALPTSYTAKDLGRDAWISFGSDVSISANGEYVLVGIAQAGSDNLDHDVLYSTVTGKSVSLPGGTPVARSTLACPNDRDGQFAGYSVDNLGQVYGFLSREYQMTYKSGNTQTVCAPLPAAATASGVKVLTASGSFSDPAVGTCSFRPTIDSSDNYGPSGSIGIIWAGTESLPASGKGFALGSAYADCPNPPASCGCPGGGGQPTYVEATGGSSFKAVLSAGNWGYPQLEVEGINDSGTIVASPCTGCMAGVYEWKGDAFPKKVLANYSTIPFHAGSQINDAGDVLVSDGNGDELYQPATGTVTPIAPPGGGISADDLLNNDGVVAGVGGNHTPGPWVWSLATGAEPITVANGGSVGTIIAIRGLADNGDIIATTSTAENYLLTPSCQASTLPSRASTSRAIQGCLSITIEPVPTTVKSGLTWFKSDDTVGFLREGEGERRFRDACISGCSDVLVTVKDGSGHAAADADVTAAVSAPATRSGTEIAPSEGQGYLCVAPKEFQNGWDSDCGHVQDVKTDANGEVLLHYWAPSVWAPPDASGPALPAVAIQVTAKECRTTCDTPVTKTTDVSLAPHLIYTASADLANPFRLALIAWYHDHEVPVTRGSALASYLLKLARLAKWAPLAKLARRIPGTGIPLLGDMVNLFWLAWFAKTFHLKDDGLINLNAKDFADYVESYLGNPVADQAWAWFKAHVWKSHSYSEVTVSVLKDLAEKLWIEDKSPKNYRHLTLALYEGSYCHTLPGDHACRGTIGVHDNLYMTFSAVGNPNYFVPNSFVPDPAITVGYAAPTWLRAQCKSAAKCEDAN